MSAIITRVEVAEGWKREGERADALAIVEVHGRKWVVVLFDGDAEPKLVPNNALRLSREILH